MPSMITAQQLTKHYRRRLQTVCVFKDLTFTHDRGQLLLLVGPNGAGKSTLLRLLAGLLLPTSGSLLVDNLPPTSARQSVRLGVLLEGERTLYWRLTVRENLLFAAHLVGFSTTQALQRIHDSAATWQVTDLLSRRYESLSSGQRKRVALMRTFFDPQATLVLLDDPCAALDAQGIELCKTALQQCLSAGTTVICSSHNDDPMRSLPHQTLELR